MRHLRTIFRSAPLLIACGAALAASPAWAIDCARAKSVTEKSVCASQDLQNFDSRMNDYYHRLKILLPPSEMAKLREEQTAWLNTNDAACNGDQACLKTRYAARVQELDDKKAATAPQTTGTLSYKTVTIKKEEPYELNLSFPQFSGPDAEKAAKLNGFVAKLNVRCDIPKGKNAAEQAASESYVNSDIQVLALNDDTAVIRKTYDIYCSPSAHPDSGTVTHFVRTQTGTEVNLWKSLPADGKKQVLKRMEKIANARLAADNECRGYFSADLNQGEDAIAIGYKGEGVFTLQPRLSHAEKACEDAADATITATELQKLYPPQSLANTIFKNLMSSPSK